MESNVSGDQLWVDTGFSNSSSASSVVSGSMTSGGGGVGVSNHGALSAMSSPLSSTSIMGPTVEVSEREISFGAIAEGCCDFKRVFFKLANINPNG